MSAAGTGVGSGAFIAYEFTASAPSMRFVLDGRDVGEETVTDHNPIIDALTLERSPGARLPQETKPDCPGSIFGQPAVAPGAATARGCPKSGLLSGGDPTDGGDFVGEFVYAVNVGPQVRSQLTALN